MLATRRRVLWDELRMSLSVVAALVHNLITVPAAVLRSRVAKDSEVLALRHENVVLRRQIAGSGTSRPTASGSPYSPG
jgi:putative transposase